MGRTWSLALAALLLAASGPAAAQSTSPLRLSAAEIAALPSTTGANGLRTAIILGDPAKAGPYTIAVTYPAHSRVAPHVHRDNRTSVVISGQWFFGYGVVAEDAATKGVGPGGVFTEPAGQAHFGHGGDQPTLVYVSGFGPSDTLAAKP